MKITIEPGEPAEVRDIVGTGLNQFNRDYSDQSERRPLTLTARTDDGTVIGGIISDIEWQWLHVKWFWIHADYRRRRIGTELLRAAEAAALAEGCTNVYLDTFDFQARGFYEKQGYELYGVQEGFPQQRHRRFLMRKQIGKGD